MDTTDQEVLLDALNTLVTSGDAKHLYQSLTAVVALKIVHDVWFSGDAAVLNVLIPIGRKDPARFTGLIGKVDAARRKNLKAPLVEVDEGFDKTEYMREFMYQKRQRTRRAAEIENLRRPPRDRLIGRARLDFMDAQSRRWITELDAKLETGRIAHGGRLPLELDRALRTSFWEGIDRQLDAQQAEACSVKKVGLP